MDRSEVIERLRGRWAAMGGKLGMAFMAAGFVALFLAWNGAADLDYTQGQIPYLISGGVGGLGLIIIGAALLVIESSRRDRIELEGRLDELINAVGRMAPVAAATASGNGHEGPQAKVTVPADPGMVVAGQSSFHRPDCHLLGERATGDLLPREQAESDGLSACRICNP